MSTKLPVGTIYAQGKFGGVTLVVLSPDRCRRLDQKKEYIGLISNDPDSTRIVKGRIPPHLLDTVYAWDEKFKLPKEYDPKKHDLWWRKWHRSRWVSADSGSSWQTSGYILVQPASPSAQKPADTWQGLYARDLKPGDVFYLQGIPECIWEVRPSGRICSPGTPNYDAEPFSPDFKVVRLSVSTPQPEGASVMTNTDPARKPFRRTRALLFWSAVILASNVLGRVVTSPVETYTAVQEWYHAPTPLEAGPWMLVASCDSCDATYEGAPAMCPTCAGESFTTRKAQALIDNSWSAWFWAHRSSRKKGYLFQDGTTVLAPGNWTVPSRDVQVAAGNK